MKNEIVCSKCNKSSDIDDAKLTKKKVECPHCGFSINVSSVVKDFSDTMKFDSEDTT